MPPHRSEGQPPRRRTQFPGCDQFLGKLPCPGHPVLCGNGHEREPSKLIKMLAFRAVEPVMVLPVNGGC